MAWSASFEDFSSLDADIPDTIHSRKTVPSFSSYPGTTQEPDVNGNAPVHICDLITGICNEKLVGLVIAKGDARHFPSKKDPTVERYVVAFTLRDSPTDFINITCWGNEQYIADMSQQFHVGDIVELRHFHVQDKPQDGSEEKYRPWTSSQYLINLSENKSTLDVVTDLMQYDFNALMHIPVKPSNDFYTIADIMANGQNINGKTINILGIVKKDCQGKEITTKLGKKLWRCEVKFFDDTSSNLALVIWDKEMGRLAESWIPKEHVVFAVDVRITYDNYRKCMMATATSRTIFTINPDTREAHSLYQYAQTAQIEDTPEVSFQDGNTVDLASIHDVFTIEQIKQKQEVMLDAVSTVNGIVYACITEMDIDGDPSRVVIARCTKCKLRIDSVTGICMNQKCPQGSLPDLDALSTETDLVFDLKVSISDPTGTLSFCRPDQKTVTSIVGCQAEEFLQLSDEQKTQLKWQYLMERCKLYFKVNLPTFEKTQATVRILSCERADMREVVQNLQ